MISVKYTDAEGLKGYQFISTTSQHMHKDLITTFDDISSVSIDSSISADNACAVVALMKQNKNIKKLIINASDDYNLTLCNFPCIEHLMVFSLARIHSDIILAQIYTDIAKYISSSGTGVASIHLDIVNSTLSRRLIDAIGNLTTLRELYINVYSHNDIITQILKKNKLITSILIDVETKNASTDELIETLSTYSSLRCCEINRWVSWPRWKKLADVLPTTVNTIKYHHSFDSESDKILADILSRKHITCVRSNTCSNETFAEVLKTDHVIKYITDNAQVHVSPWHERAEQLMNLLKTNTTLLYCSMRGEYGEMITRRRCTNSWFVKQELMTMALPLIQQQIFDLYVIKHIYDYVNMYSHDLNLYTCMQILEKLRESILKHKKY